MIATPKVDFRHAAIEASRRQLAEAGHGAPERPLESGLSFCIPTGDDAAAFTQQVNRVYLVGLALGFAALLLGPYIMLFDGLKMLDDTTPLRLVVGLCFTVLGISIFFLALRHASHLVRRRVGGRLGEWPFAPEQLMAVQVGNPEWKTSGSVSDPAILVLHRDRRCVRIEGVGCRYVICGDDVVEVATGPASSIDTLIIRYQIGPETLAISLIGMGTALAALHGLRGRSKLMQLVKEALTGESLA